MKTKKPSMKESSHQIYLFNWARLQIPEYEPLLFHIPNGGTRNPVEAYNLKRQGVKAGIPDLFMAVARGSYHGLFIELKSEEGRVTDSQLYMLNAFEKSGYHTCICYGWEEAKNKIEWYLKLV